MTAPNHDLSTSQAIINGVVVVLLFDFQAQHRAWAWLKLIQGTNNFRKKMPGLLFAKIMGSGEGGGFSLKPSGTHQGLIFVFDCIQNASNYLHSDELKRYCDKTRESWQGVMAVHSCRGTWNGKGWQSKGVLDGYESAEHATGPLASLTRGSIRATQALAFWKHAPAAQNDLLSAPGCELAVGLGEAPLLRQCTFSLWSNAKSLIDYAQQGAHLKAITAAHKYNFFSESMFVRMQVLHMAGKWRGREYNQPNMPLAPLEINR